MRNRFRIGTLVQEGRRGEPHYIDGPLPEDEDKFYTLSLVKPIREFKVIRTDKVHESKLRLYKQNKWSKKWK